MKNKICLVLSGGGSRGFAHVGAIKALNELEIPISRIICSSMGAVIGAKYAMDKDPELIENFAKVFCEDPKKYLILKNSTIKIREKKLREFFKIIYDSKLQEKTKIPLDIVVSHFHSGTPVILKHGLIYKNVLASISMPFINKPIIINGEKFVDPGFISNFPVEFYDPKYGKLLGINVGSTKITFQKSKGIVGKVVKKDDILNLVMSTLYVNKAYEKEKIKQYSEYGMIIEPDGLDNISSTDFTNVEALINSGYKEIYKNKEEILKCLES